MTNAEIVSKLWNLCNVLRDDGITYHQYVTELTYILFLKMAKETGSEKNIPEGYRWDILKTKEGMEGRRSIRKLEPKDFVISQNDWIVGKFKSYGGIIKC